MPAARWGGFQFGQGAAIRRIGGNQLLVDGEIHGGGDNLVDISDGFGAQSLGLTFGLNPLHPAAAQQLFVQLL